MLEYEGIYFEVVIQTENGLYRRTVACWSTKGYTSKWLFRLKMGCIEDCGVLEYEGIYFEVVIQTENGLYRRTVACRSTKGYTSKWLFRQKNGLYRRTV